VTPDVVREKRHRADLLWGFLTGAFAIALVRGHLGAGSDRSRLVIDVCVGGVLVLLVTAWVWTRRHPAALEVSYDRIALRHRDLPKSTELRRGCGDLYFARSGGRVRFLTLRATGSPEVISLQMFDPREVERACRSHRWRFAGDP
jgi:hypothetical protein